MWIALTLFSLLVCWANVCKSDFNQFGRSRQSQNEYSVDRYGQFGGHSSSNGNNVRRSSGVIFGHGPNNSTTEALYYVTACTSSNRAVYSTVEPGLKQANEHLDLIANSLVQRDINYHLEVIRLGLRIMFRKIAAIYTGMVITHLEEGSSRSDHQRCVTVSSYYFHDWDRAQVRILIVGKDAVRTLLRTGRIPVLSAADKELQTLYPIFQDYIDRPGVVQRGKLASACQQATVGTNAGEVLREFNSIERPNDVNFRNTLIAGYSSFFVSTAAMRSICYLAQNAESAPRVLAERLLADTEGAVRGLRSLQQRILQLHN